MPPPWPAAMMWIGITSCRSEKLGESGRWMHYNATSFRWGGKGVAWYLAGQSAGQSEEQSEERKGICLPCLSDDCLSLLPPNYDDTIHECVVCGLATDLSWRNDSRFVLPRHPPIPSSLFVLSPHPLFSPSFSLPVGQCSAPMGPAASRLTDLKPSCGSPQEAFRSDHACFLSVEFAAIRLRCPLPRFPCQVAIALPPSARGGEVFSSSCPGLVIFDGLCARNKWDGLGRWLAG